MTTLNLTNQVAEKMCPLPQWRVVLEFLWGRVRSQKSNESESNEVDLPGESFGGGKGELGRFQVETSSTRKYEYFLELQIYMKLYYYF